ncbi:MAG: hypothetical protein OEV52_04765 [Dehalococcoidia bacterium]|nr:hypothetical protein [Dehalococcoidia bacterium]MDH4291123.1 hypothetical protein [Dehalococcoidia bacterium]
MKKLLLLVPILALLLLPMGCEGIEEGIINSMFSDMLEKLTGNFTIKVGGTDGLNFTGEYEVWFLHYDPDTESIVYTKDSYTVEGQVPEQYTFEGDVTTVIFQKQTGDYSLLTVEIWRDEELLADTWRETSEPWGAVWVGGAIVYE